jgi:hypothetical protein
MPKVSTPQAVHDDAPDAINTVEAVLPLKAYLVKYRDGEGKQQVRVALKTEGPDHVSVIQAHIQGTQVVSPATGWFAKELLLKLDGGPKSV